MKKRKKTSSAALAVLLAWPLLGGVTPLVSQQHAPQERVAEGTVVGRNDAPLPGAIVYLKDAKSTSVKTYIADSAGHFRFGELSQDSDYDLWAESNGVHSKHKSISQFSSKNNYNFTLKLEP